MKKVAPLLVLALAFLGGPRAYAQWQTVTYNLRGGWNAIYLHGDASYATIDTLLASNPEVLSVWRWNPNPTQTGFSTSPLIPSTGTSEWSVWTRGDATGSTLSTLTGQAAYLIQCSGTASDTRTISLTQKALPPRAVWVRSGANFLGFPTRSTSGTYPLFSNYFATYSAAISVNSRAYKYVGGPLGPTNPAQIFSTSSERLDRNQAYWFESPVVGDFYAPVEITPSLPEGMNFGRTGSLISVLTRNRGDAPITLTVAPVASAAAPSNQEAITGAVPLKRRVFVAATGLYNETAVGTGFSEVIGPQSSLELSFVVDRSALTGSSGAFYASLLRFTDSSNLIDISLPVSARVGSFAGLWVGDIAVTRVNSQAPGSDGTGTVGRPFPLRVLLHVDDTGQARLLSQVYVGKLSASPTVVGIATRESALLASAKSDALRIVAAHLPLDTALGGAGTVALGSTLVRTVTLPFDDRVNPFVHAYHPDHDNRDARGAPLSAGVESPAVTRVCSFTFSATPVGDASALGWGSTVLGGGYSETVTGLHKNPLTLSGTFIIRRVNETGTITLN